MSTKKPIFRMLVVLLVVVMMTSTASARPLYAALGTGFTYQGKLTDGGVPANGMYDLEFKLYDALSGGSPVGSTVTQGDVTVTAGLFTVQLDFGNVFDGTALYLEIGVRPGVSTGAYTALTPRQSLTATPYAIYAAKVPWSGISGVPAGFADGVDNTGGVSYQNVKIVAKSGGDFTTITAALNSIATASDINHYLIKVAPGVYSEQVTMKPFVDIEGAGELTTKITFTGNADYDTGTLVGADNAELRFLTVENTGGAAFAIAIYNNSAARLTHVSASASGGGTDNYGVYNGNLSSLSTMTDVNTSASGGTGSYGVWNDTSSPTMTNVTATASRGSNENVGVKNTGYLSITSPVMTNVTATASGESNNFGVLNEDSSPTMMNIIATASGGAESSNIGIENWYSSSPTMTNVIATASGGSGSTGVDNQETSSPTMTNVTATASGGTNGNTGVRNVDSSSPTMTNVTATGSGGMWARGVENQNFSSTKINNSVISASDGSGSTSGVRNADTATVWINNSQISGSDNTISNAAGANAFVGASQLSGGAVNALGTITCIGVYNASYLALNSTCQ